MWPGCLWQTVPVVTTGWRHVSNQIIRAMWLLSAQLSSPAEKLVGRVALSWRERDRERGGKRAAGLQRGGKETETRRDGHNFLLHFFFFFTIERVLHKFIKAPHFEWFIFFGGCSKLNFEWSGCENRAEVLNTQSRRNVSKSGIGEPACPEMSSSLRAVDQPAAPPLRPGHERVWWVSTLYPSSLLGDHSSCFSLLASLHLRFIPTRVKSVNTDEQSL